MLPLTIQSPMLLLSNRVVAMDILDVQSAACQWTRSVREAEMVHVRCPVCKAVHLWTVGT